VALPLRLMMMMIAMIFIFFVKILLCRGMVDVDVLIVVMKFVDVDIFILVNRTMSAIATPSSWLLRGGWTRRSLSECGVSARTNPLMHSSLHKSSRDCYFHINCIFVS